jgi:mycothiol synthase
MRPTPYEAGAVRAFLVDLADTDGHPPLSEHKLSTLGGVGNRAGVWSDDAGLCLVAVSAHHRGAGHWATEAALAPRRRTPDGEAQAIERAVGLVPSGQRHSVWAFRPGQIDAVLRLGYDRIRAVLRMTGPMPHDAVVMAPGITIEPMVESEVGIYVAINNRAFADHREQGSMTEREFRSLMALDWFDPEGVHIARSGPRVVGFCVTKHEHQAVGEVYLLAVDPDLAGKGIGRSLLQAGFGRLADRGAALAQAWVDASNVAAVGLYEAVGLTGDFRNEEFVVPSGSVRGVPLSEGLSA